MSLALTGSVGSVAIGGGYLRLMCGIWVLIGVVRRRIAKTGSIVPILMINMY